MPRAPRPTGIKDRRGHRQCQVETPQRGLSCFDRARYDCAGTYYCERHARTWALSYMLEESKAAGASQIMIEDLDPPP